MTKREFTSYQSEYEYDSGYEYDVVGSAVSEIYYEQYGQQYEQQLPKAQPAPKNHGRVLFQILLLFSMGIALVWGYTGLNEANNKVQALRQEYELLRKENDYMNEQLEKSINLNAVRDTAINKLGMRRPDKSQIVYIKLKTNDYGEKVDAE